MKQLKFNPDKDMKELEKYGFEYNERFKDYERQNWNNEMCIGIKTKKFLIMSNNNACIDDLSVIYDLIKANLLIVEEKDD